MTRNNRRDIIKKIEEKRNSKVITYVTSDRTNLSVSIASDVVPIVHEHILKLAEDDRKKLDLFIYSRGGDGDVPWTIVSMFREYSEKGSFSCLIPYRAHSAATIIALGADEIIMTKKAELGPIDATLANGPYNPKDEGSKGPLPISVEDVTGYFSLMEKVGCERPNEKMMGFEFLTNNIHPLALGAVNRSLEETKLVALRLLNTRSNPFTEEENGEIVKRISSEVYSHRHTISRTEARRYIGLKQVKNAEDEPDVSKELWDLYKEYKTLFHLDDPFQPEQYIISNNLDSYTWDNLKLACIESLGRCDICTKDMRVTRLKQIPPQVNLNLNITNFNIPNITAAGTVP